MAKEKDKKDATVAKKAKNSSKNTKNSVTSGNYWKEVKLEMSKVIWPTRNELASYTVVVLVVCAAFAIGFQLIDMGVLEFLKKVLNVTIG